MRTLLLALTLAQLVGADPVLERREARWERHWLAWDRPWVDAVGPRVVCEVKRTC
jgi:hypothetical protein